MGKFSRDPKARLGDARSKHYVSVRMQQGVPITDDHLNLLGGLPRIEFEDGGKWVLGNGVPLRSNGFRVIAIPGGNVNTINLKSKIIGVGLSKLKIDLATSSAAAALGFNATNSFSQRFGTSPAQLTGNKAAPFSLANGNTLVIKADNNPPETITFLTAAFANIAAATAAEVIAVINSALNVSARAGTGNDFIVTGGDGTTDNAGRILVDGQMALNESDLKYSEQPLFANTILAQLWQVPVVDELTTPAVNETYVVYLDIWNRQVDSNEDTELVDARIGVESTLPQRREWAVRIATAAAFPALDAARPPGHTFYRLAHIDRVGAQARIEDQMITDERETDLALRREVFYRALDGTVQVTSAALLALLRETRENVRDFILFLTTKFVTPDSGYVAGEVIGIESLVAIANLAEHGMALLNAKSLDTKGAILLFGQILDAERRFVSTWETTVLPIVKPAGKIYEIAFKDVIARIKTFVTGPAPIGFISIEAALQQKNLFEADRSQAQINASFNSEVGKPIGTLLLTYLGSTSPAVVKNVPFDMRYKVTGTVTPRDDLDVEPLLGAGWQSTVKNSNGSTPLSIAFGPGTDSREFIVTVQPPNLDVANTQINLRVSAKHNTSGLTHTSTPKTLTVGQPPPLSEQDFAIAVGTTNVVLVGDAFRVPINLASANITFRVFNNTNSSVPVALEFVPPGSPPGWNIVKDGFPVDGNIPALTFRSCLIQFVEPKVVDQELTFTFRARNSATNAVLAETTIKLRTAAGV
jgi:hypothetical protein